MILSMSISIIRLILLGHTLHDFFLFVLFFTQLVKDHFWLFRSSLLNNLNVWRVDLQDKKEMVIGTAEISINCIEFFTSVDDF